MTAKGGPCGAGGDGHRGAPRGGSVRRGRCSPTPAPGPVGCASRVRARERDPASRLHRDPVAGSRPRAGLLPGRPRPASRRARPLRQWAGDTCIGIWVPEEQGMPFVAQKGSPLPLGVDDVPAAKADVEAKGVEFSATSWTPGSATWRSSTTRTATTSCCTTATRRTGTEPRRDARSPPHEPRSRPAQRRQLLASAALGGAAPSAAARFAFLREDSRAEAIRAAAAARARDPSHEAHGCVRVLCDTRQRELLGQHVHPGGSSRSARAPRTSCSRTAPLAECAAPGPAPPRVAGLART